MKKGHNWGLCRKCGQDHGQPLKGVEHGGTQSGRSSCSTKAKVIVLKMRSRIKQTQGEATPDETIDIWRLLIEHDQKMKRKEHEVSTTS